MEFIVLIILLIALIIFFRLRNSKKSEWKIPQKPFPTPWKVILMENVAFYNSLNSEEEKLFEFKIQEFLLNVRITGIETNVDQKDEILIAASAIIPIFQFPEWKYTRLYEVLVYPSSFNEKFETQREGRSILGMVGSGYMAGKMILSKKALHHGFSNASDKKNTAVHEFVHLIDKTDGVIDGVPELLLDKQYVIPWIDLINKKIDEIYANKSDINPYGATNRSEFFSVISEYFFERPQLLKRKHPELYQLLEEVFNQDMSARALEKEKLSIGRNSPCPCNSGKKFKKCCGRNHY
ncbi:peptidase [Lentimicrobium sp. L6]|uniref:M90 family metallopeptidase n=1 Tax=Lentimicrobium sp. L6 TaxID=2735916 RepID=UPI00155678A7|nr:M90 family metallopeptidase [Lentimicrobium sp. L6]NPD83382.1 peptidase [Lentimicrobium sp. L6]